MLWWLVLHTKLARTSNEANTMSRLLRLDKKSCSRYQVPPLVTCRPSSTFSLQSRVLAHPKSPFILGCSGRLATPGLHPGYSHLDTDHLHCIFTTLDFDLIQNMTNISFTQSRRWCFCPFHRTWLCHQAFAQSRQDLLSFSKNHQGM